jgi:hypothetical protein
MMPYYSLPNPVVVVEEEVLPPRVAWLQIDQIVRVW